MEDRVTVFGSAGFAERGSWQTHKGALLGFTICALVLGILFGKPLSDLARLALNTELYSHVLLIPFISLYLIWARREGLAWSHLRRSPVLMLVPAALGLVLLLALWTGQQRGWQPAREDSLFLAVTAFVLLMIASGLFFFGRRMLGSVAFPIALLFLLAPFPGIIEHGLEAFFQHTSAEAASILFSVSGTPVFREGLVFRLPGIALEVARECSGIRSSLVLFITSLLAGYLFFQSPWRRALLAGFVIPLAIVRNGFRIFTIGMLCVHVDPDMIHSWIHRKGGPLFFVLSLLPFFALMAFLRRSERNQGVNRSGLANPASPSGQDDLPQSNLRV